MNHLVLVAGMCAALSSLSLAQEQAARPNVLFIAVDDLNDWLGCMGGHPQAKTPNLDRLARSSILFTNAHCAAPACNPSRTAIFTGRSPHRSGVYANGQKMRNVLPKAELMPKTFSRNGYWSAGSGKMLHYFIDARSWDEYFPEKTTENPFPRTLYPERRPVSLPVGGPWQYRETDWGPLDATDEEFGGDWSVSQWIGKQLRRKHDKPFFLACGIYRPHEPWFVPKKYFEQFPLESVQLPPGYKASDLDDLPPSGKRAGPNRYFAHIRAHKQWRPAVQAYLASIAFADAMVGRVMDALEKGPNADNTIVVLWSDHGWHLGEKQHWQKFTAWRVCTRVPLMVRVPAGVPGLPAGTRPGVSSRPVNLLSLYPTLLQLCGLPPRKDNDGPSLVPLLKDPAAKWPHVSVTHLGNPGSFGLSAEGWRYIHYRNGDEELYNTARDPYEWTNLAAVKEHANKLAELRARAPKEFAKKPQQRVESLPKLVWHPLNGKLAAPASKPDGNSFPLVFINRRKDPVSVYWMSRSGERKPYGEIAAGRRLRRSTRPGAVWMIADRGGKGLGYFRVGDRSSRAIVPGHTAAQDGVRRRNAGLPNIVIILADDLGFQDVGYHGGKIDTPNIDRLARDGVRLENFHACPLCSPTRAGLMTGRWPIRYGMGEAVITPWRKYGLPTTEHTLADLLAKAGYERRAVIGKWHIGHYRKALLPLNRGFTHFYGHYNGAFDYFTHKREGQLDWHRNFETCLDEGYSTTLIGREAARFIAESPKDKPFFLYVPFNAPHTPLQAKKADIAKYADRVKNKNKRIYAAMVDSMDQAIGEVLAAIEKKGVARNTFVLFFSDNGGTRHGDNRPLRAGKGSVYEGGVRVPAVVRWPAGIRGSRVVDAMMGHIDVYPMVKRLAGITAKDPNPLDGRDMLDVIRGEAEAQKRDWFSYIAQGKPEQIAICDGVWKLVVRRGRVLDVKLPKEGWRQPKAGPIVELFRLDRDLGERENLATKEPEVLAQLLARLQTHRRLKITGVPNFRAGRKGFQAPRDWVIEN